MLGLFLQTLNITLPVFAMLFLGVVLKRVGWIDDGFIRVASALVFNLTMPCLLFLGILHADFRTAFKPGILIYYSLATFVSFALIWWYATWRVPFADRGVYVQGAFRGNNGVVGLALAASMYGAYGISLGAILAGVVIVCYNALSVVVLAVYTPGVKSDPWSIFVNIVRNPLIISVFGAIPFAVYAVTLPGWLEESGQSLARMTLPLALICIGGSLSLAALRESSRTAIDASLMKMVGLPLFGTLGGWAFGFRGADLGILFLYFGAPTASVSYVMVRAAGGNYPLAAAIVVITTVAAAVTTNVGIFLLQWAGLV
ncbi:AEC family transporter [Pseudomonas typographi]|uniref:AEC family transporter n=1 Tax=Pseudomonas typographi TaxID=2715964 RepID=A0ABR7YW48_9PSED|nr:AEC family transporter [Pseudomonas typographi]MBD1553353.1 AEC family transporter [Pseudomonas typographi]MBD1585718.1 AEC family transporter [Pseudomonas typographi]MBD1597369.1 AEC family transporter [Pseudomonas typographi]